VARQAVTVRYSTIALTLAARATERSRSIERDMQRFSRPNGLRISCALGRPPR